MTFFARKHAERAYRPARNKFMVFVTNRYSVHVVVLLMVVVTVGVNIESNEVRAETFGEQTLMYALITNSNNEIVEEFASDRVAYEFASVQYRESTALSSVARGVDFIYSDDSRTVLFGGGALATPTISQGSESVAPRQDVESYVVSSGDTLSTIAEQFGISLNTLLWSNDLTVRSVLSPGDSLTILPTTGILHTVKSGDTLSKIANTYDAESEEILSFNKLASADDLVVGESIMVPGGERVVSTPSRNTAFSNVLSPPVSTAPTTSTVAPTTTGSGSMVWPTDLSVITQYYGWSHTGIDVDCHFTHNNYASDYGVVSYAGWRNGYGYTVEINHGNGIMTRYGHHASIYVSPGQQVTKGQAIGLCGTSGRSTGTHLHFEVIVNGRFTNPLNYIGR